MNRQKTLLHGDNTSDINLVSALVTMGVDAETGAVNTPRGIQRIYMLSPESNDGRYTTKELLSAWYEGEEWIKRNGEHPFAYVMSCLMRRKSLIDGIKKDRPMERVSNGDSISLLKPDCSKEVENKVLGGAQ